MEYFLSYHKTHWVLSVKVFVMSELWTSYEVDEGSEALIHIFTITLWAYFDLNCKLKIEVNQYLSRKQMWWCIYAGIILKYACVLSHVWFSANPLTIANQAPLSMEVSRQEYWSGCHFPLQGIFWSRDQTHVSCVSCIAGGSFTTSAIWEALS